MTAVSFWRRQDAWLRETPQQASFTWPKEWR